MMPIAPLMIEHRLIERMVKVMKDAADLMDRTGKVRPEFIDEAVDFISTYADRCHHGKEEDILFRLLSEKTISDDHRRTMDALIEDHVRARRMTSELAAAKERYLLGEATALNDVKTIIRDLADLYPGHIEKEDHHFFVPCMSYFTDIEQDDILEQFWEFDRMLIHLKYRSVVEKLEGRR
jgi:hemerythrin-like domain-containing protein